MSTRPWADPFTGIAIPKGSTIIAAYVQFTTRAKGGLATSATIRGEAADAASTFTYAHNGVSSRPVTTAAVAWTPVSWTSVGLAGIGQRTPPLSTVVQEIVNREGWASGSSLALLIQGISGSRSGWAYNGSAGKAPLLHVEYAPPS